MFMPLIGQKESLRHMWRDIQAFGNKKSAFLLMKFMWNYPLIVWFLYVLYVKNLN